MLLWRRFLRQRADKIASRTLITLITAITVMMVIARRTFPKSPAKGVTVSYGLL